MVCITINNIIKVEEKKEIKEIKLEEKKVKKESSGLCGICSKDYFIEKQNIKEDKNICFLNKEDFEIDNVLLEDNSGYQALALQIYGNEESYVKIKQSVFAFLFNNKENLLIYGFEKDGKIIDALSFIQLIKTRQELISDLELSSFAFLYNAEIYIFEKKLDGKIHLLNECARIEDNTDNKLFINLCLVDGNQFQVLYEKNRVNNFCNLEEINENLEKNILKQDNLNLKFEYSKDNRKTKYSDIYNFLGNNANKKNSIYPDYINNIPEESKQRVKKREFRQLTQKYLIDIRTRRLKIQFNILCKKYAHDYKEFYIVYIVERFNCIKEIHEIITHNEERKRTLNQMIKEFDFWWYGMHNDIKNYAHYCPKCKAKT